MVKTAKHLEVQERYIYHPQTFMPELHSSIPYSSTKLIALFYVKTDALSCL